MDKTVWAPVSKFESSEGTRFYYKCNKALCKMRVYIHCTSITAEYCIYRSEGQHEHVISSTNRGVTQQQKDEIIRLYESGVTFPKNIAAQLKSKDLEIEISKLKNFIASHKKKTLGKSTIKLHEVLEWCQANSSIPDDYDEVFTGKYDIFERDPIKKTQVIRVFFTTKRLLSIATINKRHLCTDATYKLIWQGFPVLIVGTTDKDKKFHPFGTAVCTFEDENDFAFIFNSVKDLLKETLTIDYKPSILVADASSAITNGFEQAFGPFPCRVVCWAHVIRNVDKKLMLVSDRKMQASIRADICSIQLATNEERFDLAMQLFFQKWRRQGTLTAEFLDYFNAQWVTNNKGWFEGYAPSVPSTNNALESFNRNIDE